MGEEYLLIAALLMLAVGVALLLGTGAAMVQAKRTGQAPGDDRELATPVATPGIMARLVIGAAITAGGAWGVWWFFA